MNSPAAVSDWFILARVQSPESPPPVKPSLGNQGIARQLAIYTSGLCLLVGLALVILAAISSRHMQRLQLDEYGAALASQIATRITSALETGDLLSVAASLQGFVESSSAQQVAIFDVEGKALGQAGRADGSDLHRYRAPVYVESDTAGSVVITLDATSAGQAQRQFVLSLLGLAVLLSVAVYGASLRLGQRQANRLLQMARAIRLEDHPAGQESANEFTTLARHIEALPMDLLRTRSETNPRDENYRTTAVLYLNLTSLVNYVDTLDEESLHRYTNRLHQVVLAASGFYGGDLQVARQFGLVVCFTGENSAGSAAFRAASCAWLIHAVCRGLEQHMSLSLSVAMAVAQSELGVGDASDIYPGLYLQHTVDELQAICANRPPQVLLSPEVAADVDVSGRSQTHETEVGNYVMLEEFAGPWQDLLERQLRLVLKRLEDPAGY